MLYLSRQLYKALAHVLFAARDLGSVREGELRGRGRSLVEERRSGGMPGRMHGAVTVVAVHIVSVQLTCFSTTWRHTAIGSGIWGMVQGLDICKRQETGTAKEVSAYDSRY